MRSSAGSMTAQVTDTDVIESRSLAAHDSATRSKTLIEPSEAALRARARSGRECHNTRRDG